MSKARSSAMVGAAIRTSAAPAATAARRLPVVVQAVRRQAETSAAATFILSNVRSKRNTLLLPDEFTAAKRAVVERRWRRSGTANESVGGKSLNLN